MAALAVEARPRVRAGSAAVAEVVVRDERDGVRAGARRRGEHAPEPDRQAPDRLVGPRLREALDAEVVALDGHGGGRPGGKGERDQEPAEEEEGAHRLATLACPTMADTLEGPARALFSAPNYAHLSVARRDGSIQNAVIWVDVDDAGRIVVNSEEGRAWPANLRRAGQATVSIHNPETPQEYVAVSASLTGDTNEGAADVIEALSHKYTGNPYPADKSKRVTFTLTPERVTYRPGN